MVERMLAPRAPSQNALAREVGVPQPTLSRWLREAKLEGMKDEKAPPPKRWTAEEKLRVVLAAAAAGEAGLGALLRREGLHEADLQRFRDEALEGLRDKSARSKKAAENKRVKELERELRRKEKSLAEAAALLVLRKKAVALWGEAEGDDTNEPSER